MKNKFIPRLLLLTLLLLATLAAVTVVSAQGLLSLDWWTADGGGLSQGESYSLHGGIGQPDAAVSSGGQFDLSGGFWSGGAPAEIKVLVHLPFVLKH